MRIEGTGNRLFYNATNRNVENKKEALKAQKNENNDDKKSITLYSKKESRFNDLIKNLNEIKDNYKKQKETILAGKDDVKVKEAKLKEINDKILDVESQILEFESQKKQEELEKSKKEVEKKDGDKQYNETGDEVREGVIISKSLNNILDVKVAMDRIHILKENKNRGAIEAEYLKINDNPKSYNNIKMAKIKRAEIKADIGIAKELGKAIHAATNIHENVLIDKVKYNDKLQSEKEETNKEDSNDDKSIEDKNVEYKSI